MSPTTDVPPSTPLEPLTGLVPRPPEPEEPALYTRGLGCLRLYLSDIERLLNLLRRWCLSVSMRIGSDLEVPNVAAIKDTRRSERAWLTIVTENPEIVVRMHGLRPAVSTTDHTGGGKQLADLVADSFADRRSTWVWLGPGVLVGMGWLAALTADVVLMAVVVRPTHPVGVIGLTAAHVLLAVVLAAKKALTLRRAGRVIIVPAMVAERRISLPETTLKIGGPVLGAIVGALLAWLLLTR
jgi:hypothetical protein